MRVDPETQTIELSRTNLRALLLKLDGFPAGSACTIYKDGWFVKAVENAEHYGADRPRGLMHDDTEAALGDG